MHGKGAIGKMAKDEEFARKLQNTLDKLSAISIVWKRAKAQPANCCVIPRSTTTQTRCS